VRVLHTGITCPRVPVVLPRACPRTQVWCQVLSADGSIDPEIVALNAASAALLLAPTIPFTHPVGCVRRCGAPPGAQQRAREGP
jgi:polyribonucleotide nucleotidyltransferase